MGPYSLRFSLLTVFCESYFCILKVLAGKFQHFIHFRVSHAVADGHSGGHVRSSVTIVRADIPGGSRPR